jgi:hypothetical protein
VFPTRLSQPGDDPTNYILQGDKLYHYAPGGNVFRTVQFVMKYGSLPGPYFMTLVPELPEVTKSRVQKVQKIREFQKVPALVHHHHLLHNHWRIQLHSLLSVRK